MFPEAGNISPPRSFPRLSPGIARLTQEEERPVKTFLLSVAVVFGSVAAASACDPVYKKVVCTEMVFVTVVKSVPYKKEVIKYDECGKPYCATVTCYKDVAVRVVKTVEVVKYIKVCG